MSTDTLPSRDDGEPTPMGFLMTPDYTMVTLASAIAVLRIANRMTGRPLYRWTCVTLDGAPVASSDGLRIVPDGDIESLGPVDILFVCGGYHVEKHCDRRLLDTLRGLARRGATFGALCTGTHLLAAAGLMDGYRCAIHWENLPALRERFPRVQASSRLFEIDRDRYTCSGGISSIDLMVRIVGAAHGQELAQNISEQIIVERIRTEQDAQRTPLHHLPGAANHDKLVDAVALMEANIEEPLTLGEVASYLTVSPRQLERLFREYLHCTPSRYYLDVRLRQARLLLLQTGLSIAAIASRCGFSTPARFAKSYSAKYGRRPSDERRATA